MIKIFIDDDVKSFTREFGEIIKTKNIHFRRYSLLTVLYLYNCKKILRKYEKSLVSKYGNEILDLGYNFRIDRMFSITFKHQALMWETEEKVYPIEVLLLLGMYKKAIKYQKKLKEYLDEEKINKIIKIINEPNLILVGKKLIYNVSNERKNNNDKLMFVLFALIVIGSLFIHILLSFTILLIGIIIYLLTKANDKEQYLQFEYNEEHDGYVLVSGRHYNFKELVVPDVYEGKFVVGIRQNAFENNLELIKIEFGSNISYIEEGAFSGCFNLKQVDFYSNKNIKLESFKNYFDNTCEVNMHFNIYLYIGDTLLDTIDVIYGKNYTLKLEEYFYNSKLTIVDEVGIVKCDKEGKISEDYLVYNDMKLYVVLSE